MHLCLQYNLEMKQVNELLDVSNSAVQNSKRSTKYPLRPDRQPVEKQVETSDDKIICNIP